MGLFRRASKKRGKPAEFQPAPATTLPAEFQPAPATTLPAQPAPATTVSARPEPERREMPAEARPDPDRPGWGRALGQQLGRPRQDRADRG